MAVLVRRLRALERRDCEFVLLGARETVFGGAILGEAAHQPAFFIGVLEAVVEHVVDQLAVAEAVAAARFREQIRRVGHRFHAACDHDVVGARGEQVVREHRRLHPRAAHLVDGGAAGGERQAGGERSLARGRLALSRRQHAAHDDFVHLLGFDLGALDRCADGRRAQLGGGELLQLSLERAHGGARGRDDDDGIVHGFPFK